MDNYMTKQEYLDKDNRTRKSIERQKALERAGEDSINKDATQIITRAQLYEKYLETGK